MWQELGFEWARELNQIKSATRIGDIVQGVDLLTVSSDSNTKVSFITHSYNQISFRLYLCHKAPIIYNFFFFFFKSETKGDMHVDNRKLSFQIEGS